MINCFGCFQEDVMVAHTTTRNNTSEKDLQFRYHLLLEFGHFDLIEVFSTRLPPVLPDEIERTWNALLNVAHAVDELHNLELSNREEESWFGSVYTIT